MKFYKSSLISLVAVATLVVSTTGLAKKPEDRISIVDVAVAVNEADNGLDFNTLLFAAGLYPEIAAYLGGNGQRTLFAPTDQAFANLEEDVLPLFCYDDIVELATDQPEYVADVLTYHVSKGSKDAAEVLPKDQMRMLTGDFIYREPGSLVITDELGRDANLESVDNFGDNGVIHVISEVILPYPPQTGTCD